MIINKQFYKDALGWGFILWLIGYALGIMLFTVVPLSVIGWIILPIGTTVTIWGKWILGTILNYGAWFTSEFIIMYGVPRII